MRHDAFRVAVGLAALVAPALHSLTDVMEWYHGGFTDLQLWINVVAFVPMPFLLATRWIVQTPSPRRYGLVGALLYGVAFAYFTFTTLYALALHVATYDALWTRLGATYTVFGGFMVAGGVLFAWATLRNDAFPRYASMLLLAGCCVNLVIALVPAPDILQTAGSALRNAGLMAMGFHLLFGRCVDRMSTGVER